MVFCLYFKNISFHQRASATSAVITAVDCRRRPLHLAPSSGVGGDRGLTDFLVHVFRLVITLRCCAALRAAAAAVEQASQGGFENW